MITMLHRFAAVTALLVLAACSTTSGTDPTPGEPEEPVATEIIPNRGSTSGGTFVSITGLHFEDPTAGATRVTIGGLDATDVTVIDDQTITAVTAGDALPGPVNVVVRNDNGTALMEEAFEYIELPLATILLLQDSTPRREALRSWATWLASPSSPSGP